MDPWGEVAELPRYEGWLILCSILCISKRERGKRKTGEKNVLEIKAVFKKTTVADDDLRVEVSSQNEWGVTVLI